eukprot:COSAG06_NODE_508_length_14925_cov_18.648995_7_plen_70_part_00
MCARACVHVNVHVHLRVCSGTREGEGRDRISTDLPGLQSELIKRVSAVNNNTVLILINGWCKRHTQQSF